MLGRYDKVIDDVTALINELNRVYREIVMVTGPSADTLRDYQFDAVIPDTLTDMETLIAKVRDMEATVSRLSDGGGESTAVFKRVYLQLEAMVEDTGEIAKRLSDYKNTVTELGSWLADCRSQPLELDTLTLLADGDATPRGKSSFFATIWHFIRQYVGAFSMDYSQIGMSDQPIKDEITVWAGTSTGLSSGRDQAQLIADLTRNDFTPTHQIGVNVQLVAVGSLLPATLAGRGPDVALGMAQADPVNYALRGAVSDLSAMPGAQQVYERFSPSACEPFRLEGSWYAVPETQSFPMMFCRDDVLEELGIRLEWLDTWETLMEVVLPILQKKYLDIGMPAAIGSYGMFLYQNGGAFYTDKGDASLMAQPVGIASFEQFTTLYTDYKLPITYDFQNRFRSGEMPLAIQDFTAYNQLSVFAPEIDGLWSMRPVPGTKRADGSIDRAVTGTVTGCSIMSASRKKEAAWEFIVWWTDTGAQVRYSRELETLLGSAARNPTANVEAMKKIAWRTADRAAMQEQQKSLRAIPEVAGGYFTTRHFDFAFRRVVNDGDEAREALYQAVKDINHELTAKRKEFDRRKQK